MNRLRGVLYEVAVVVLLGATIALLITGAMRFFHRPSLEDFKREYAAGDVWDQKAVAQRYLKLFPVTELLQAVEEQNAAEGCHLQGHAIGRAIYSMESNFGGAIQACGGSCTHGCFHGVMMEMFQTDSDTLGGVLNDGSPQDILAGIERIAPDLCSMPEVENVVLPRYCTHGLGHSLAYFSGNDLEASIRSCSVLTKRHAVNSCVSGVFMETLFSTTSTALLLTSGTEPCDRFPGNEVPCYRYKAYGWIYVHGGVQPALTACDRFGDFTLLCIRSVAMAAARDETVETRDGIEDLCGRLAGDKRAECVIGALLKIIDSNNGHDSDSLCHPVDPMYRDICLSMLQKFRNSIASNE